MQRFINQEAGEESPIPIQKQPQPQQQPQGCPVAHEERRLQQQSQQRDL